MLFGRDENVRLACTRQPERVGAVAHVLVPVAQLIEPLLHAFGTDLAREFLEGGNTGDLERLTQREIPVPTGKIALLAIPFPKRLVGTLEDSFLESDQRVPDFEGRAWAERFAGQGRIGHIDLTGLRIGDDKHALLALEHLGH